MVILNRRATSRSLSYDRYYARLAVLLVVALAFACFAGAGGAHAEKQIGLVIGIDTYDNLGRDAQLRKAKQDATAVAKTLQNLNFDVTLRHDVTRAEFNKIWQEFLEKLAPGDVAAFYFAGHGVELGGMNHLIPRDIPPVRPGQEQRLGRESLLLQEYLADLRERKTRLNLVIIDACRSNPFESVGGRSLGGKQGLQPRDALGTFIMYSAGAGEVALDRLADNDTNANSVYTRHLLPLLRMPGLELDEIAKQVRTKVTADAASIKHDQHPAYYNQIEGSFCIAGGDCGLKQAGSATPPAPTVAQPPSAAQPAAHPSATPPRVAMSEPPASEPADEEVARGFLKAKEAGTSDAIRKFLEAHPGRADAEVALRDLRAYESAAKLGERAPVQERIAAFAAYLKSFPEGIKANDAGRQLNALRDQALRADCDAFAKDAINGLSEMSSLGCAADARGEQWDPDVTIHRSYCYRVKEKRVEQAEARAKDLGVCREAKKRKDALETALKSNTPEAFRDFLNQWREGPAAAEARGKLEALEQAAWDAAAKKKTVDAYAAFLKAHPDGRHASEAKEAMLALQAVAKQRDDEAFAAARKADTPEAYAKYAAEFASGQHAAEVKVLSAEAAEWAKAKGANSPDKLREFAKAHIGSRFATVALAMAGELDEAAVTSACDEYASAALATLKEAEADACSFAAPADRADRFSLDPARHKAFCRSTDAAGRKAEAKERTQVVRACTRPRRDREAFEEARATGTPEAFSSFLRNSEFSASANRIPAQTMLAEACAAQWPGARKSGTWAALSRFAHHACSATGHQDEARRLLDDIDQKAWTKAKSGDTQASYIGYIKATGGAWDAQGDMIFSKRSGGTHREEAEAALADISACDSARKETEADQIAAFIDNNPNSRCRQEIKQKQAGLAAAQKRKDDAAFSKAENADTTAAYRKYLDEFGDQWRGRTALHADAANAKLQELQGYENTSFSWTANRRKALAADASNTKLKRLAVLYENGQLVLFSAGNGAVVTKTKISTEVVTEVPAFNFSRNGRYLVLTVSEAGAQAKIKNLDSIDLTSAPTVTRTLLFDGLSGGRLQTWSRVKSSGFDEDDKVLVLSSTEQDVDGFDWDLAKGRKRSQTAAKTNPFTDGRVHIAVPDGVDSTSEDQPAQLGASIDFDGIVSLTGPDPTTIGSLGAEPLRISSDNIVARFVMLETGEHFVYTPDKHYSGSTAGIAATLISMDGTNERKIPEGFRRRFYKGDALDILGLSGRQ